jgi:hypothetical protein
VLQPGDWDYVLVSRLGDFPDQTLEQSRKPEVLVGLVFNPSVYRIVADRLAAA